MPQAGICVAQDGESIRFWLRARDFLPVAVYLRPPANDRPPHPLLPVPLFEATAGRAWPAGAHPSPILPFPFGPILADIMDTAVRHPLLSLPLFEATAGRARSSCCPPTLLFSFPSFGLLIACEIDAICNVLTFWTALSIYCHKGIADVMTLLSDMGSSASPSSASPKTNFLLLIAIISSNEMILDAC